MKLLISPALVVAVTVAMALCVFGLYFVCDPEDFRKLVQEARRGEALQQEEQAILRRLESKEQLMQDVIAQRCSLSEALTRSQELEREWPGYTARQSMSHGREWPNPERRYRCITLRVEVILKDRPEEAAAVLRRLEKEYQQLQAGKHTPSTAPTERTERSR